MAPPIKGTSIWACVVSMVGLSAGPDTESNLRVTYLGNMGVLVDVDDKRVVIDGLHHGALRQYAKVPPELLEPLEQSRSPFSSLTLALTTHRHRDHFEAASVGRRLRSDPRVVFIAAEETIDSLRSALPAAGDPARIIASTPSPGTLTRHSVADLEVLVLDLPHNPVRTAKPQNVGFVVTTKRGAFLHVGDADPEPRNFAPFRLPERRIDVAFVPYWYLTGAAELVRTSIGARQVVATHVGPGEADRIKAEVERAFPGAVVFTRPGETWTAPVRP